MRTPGVRLRAPLATAAMGGGVSIGVEGRVWLSHPFSWGKWAPPPNYGGAVAVSQNPFAAAAGSGWDGRAVPQRPPRPMYKEGHVMPGLSFEPGQRGRLI